MRVTMEEFVKFTEQIEKFRASSPSTVAFALTQMVSDTAPLSERKARLLSGFYFGCPAITRTDPPTYCRRRPLSPTGNRCSHHRQRKKKKDESLDLDEKFDFNFLSTEQESLTLPTQIRLFSTSEDLSLSI
jgi:hypothetical protein